MTTEPDVSEIRSYVSQLATLAPDSPGDLGSRAIDAYSDEHRSARQPRRWLLPLLSAAAVLVVASVAYQLAIRPTGPHQPAAGTAQPTAASADPVPSPRSSALPTQPGEVPAGWHIEIGGWHLLSAAGAQLTLLVEAARPPAPGCELLDYIQVGETEQSVTISSIIFVATDPLACTAAAGITTGTITLQADLGSRTLIHGAPGPASPNN